MLKLARLAGVTLAVPEVLAQSRPLRVGAVAPMSGPASSIGVPLTQAAQALVRRINATGGVAGRELQITVRDDAFAPERTREEAASLAREPQVLALLNVVGAPNNATLVSSGLLAESGLNVIGAFTGATSVRALKSPRLFFVRASVAHEGQRMAQQIASMGIERVGLFHANDAFGSDARQHVEASLAQLGLNLVGVRTYEPASTDVGAAALALKASSAQATLLFGTGPACAQFIREYRGSGGGDVPGVVGT
jgi:ABC-type branched-subunit amino acid transport system substrate-binding protein